MSASNENQQKSTGFADEIDESKKIAEEKSKLPSSQAARVQIDTATLTLPSPLQSLAKEWATRLFTASSDWLHRDFTVKSLRKEGTPLPRSLKTFVLRSSAAIADDDKTKTLQANNIAKIKSFQQEMKKDIIEMQELEVKCRREKLRKEGIKLISEFCMGAGITFRELKLSAKDYAIPVLNDTRFQEYFKPSATELSSLISDSRFGTLTEESTLSTEQKENIELVINFCFILFIEPINRWISSKVLRSKISDVEQLMKELEKRSH